MNQLFKTSVLQKIVCRALAFSLLLGMCIGHAPAASAASEDSITVDSLLQNWRSGEGDYPSKPVVLNIPGLTDGPTTFYWWGIVSQSGVGMMTASDPPLTSTKSETGGCYYMPSNMPGVIEQPYPTYGLFCIQLQCADEARNEFFRWLLFETIDQAARYAEDGDTIVVNGDYNDFTLNGLENVTGGHQTKHGTFFFTYDISPNFKIPAGKNITIDLRGHEITFSPNAGRPGKVEHGLDAITAAYGIGPLQDGARTGIVVGQGASLTIIDSSDEQTGKIVGMARATYPDNDNASVNENAQNYCVIENNGTVIIAEGIEIDNLAADTTGAAEGTAYDVFIPESAADATIILPESMKGHFTTNVAETVGAVVSYALPADASVTVGRTTTLTVSPAQLPAGAAVEWVSDNTAVATVSDGVVTGVSAGTANITATIRQGGTTITATKACPVTVTKASGGSSGSSSASTYTVTVPSRVTGGVVKASPSQAEKGNTVTLTVTPDNGYELGTLTVTDSKGNELKLTDKGSGKYSFTMPGSKVSVKASFVQIVDSSRPDIGFVDVPTGAYYADAVAWAVEQGITSGTSTSTFSPDASCTRAQMVTFLWRAAGSPKTAGSNPFEDVQSGSYYYDAVLWAVANSITSGTSATTFAPDATVTRGQTVTFLYRAAGAPASSGSSFGDVAADAYYADAVAWAVAEGITSGTGDNQFSPDAACTRGQIVTFLYRGAQ